MFCLINVVEMCPKWFSVDKIPYDTMWPDDYLWYPMMLSKRYLNGYFKFQGMDKLLEYNIEETTTSNSS